MIRIADLCHRHLLIRCCRDAARHGLRKSLTGNADLALLQISLHSNGLSGGEGYICWRSRRIFVVFDVDLVQNLERPGAVVIDGSFAARLGFVSRDPSAVHDEIRVAPEINRASLIRRRSLGVGHRRRGAQRKGPPPSLQLKDPRFPFFHR